MHEHFFDTLQVVPSGVTGEEILQRAHELAMSLRDYGDGTVGILDFLLLLAAWGPCPGSCPPACAADLDGDCEVGVTDFLLLLANWS